MNAKVLLVGESWVSSSTHIKGFDFFSSSVYATGGDFLISALQERGIQVSHLPSHQAAKDFPFELVKEYVLQGGGLAMAGGYLSFQGIYGAARYHRSPIEEVLPVSLLPTDDRVEKPEGINP